jgi:GTPase
MNNLKEKSIEIKKNTETSAIEKQNINKQINTKAGYVAIIGKPNAGKSTLMNALIGAKLSIVTPKPQTTRKRVLGILTEENVQIIFLDTPGILNPKYKMQSAMMDYVHNSIIEADCVVFIYDVTRYNFKRPIPSELFTIIKNIKQNNSKNDVSKQNIPKNNISKDKNIIMLLNKLDLLKDRKEVLPMIATFTDMQLFSDIIPISALKKSNISNIIETITQYIPTVPFYYDAELLSTQPERFFVSEIIRENVFISYSDEIPYSTEIYITDFKEREFGKWYISAEIIVEKDSQKAIMIGKNGEKLKKVMEHSRHSIEEHLQMPIYIDVFVKVREKWRNNSNLLRSYGY